MRRILAIVLLLLFGLPSAMPLLASMQRDADAGLPACCRRHGKHHCAMSDTVTPALAARGLREVHASNESCPMRCAMLAQVHFHPLLLSAASTRLYAGLQSHPAGHAQTECRLRVSREKARGKRGPPQGKPLSESASQQVSDDRAPQA